MFAPQPEAPWLLDAPLSRGMTAVIVAASFIILGSMTMPARADTVTLYAAGSLTAYMLEDHEVTRDELYACGATFTLLAWAFAFAFSVCQIVNPGSFDASSALPQRTWMELLYLSFSLLSGVGLSDVVPVLPQARALAMLAQFAGVMYIALVVSRLIGLSVNRRDRGGA